MVCDPEDISSTNASAVVRRGGRALPSALRRFDDIAERLSGRQTAVFLDYDGTLAPIAPRPELAVLSEEMRTVVRRLAAVATTAVISGRDREDVAGLVGIDGLVYAGSHGLDIAGPDATALRHEAGEAVLPALESAFRRLAQAVGTMAGIRLERKRFSLAVHYRLVAEREVPALERAVDAVVDDHPKLRKICGKKVFELMPGTDWNKGSAVLWLMDAWGLEGDDVVPFYVGDDSTDEDAFAVLRERGVGVLVAEAQRPTRARYRLRNPDEVGRFLDELAACLTAAPR
ncbi:MAG: trehalose-phosphatase [Alphaproteobacteria bacterium]